MTSWVRVFCFRRLTPLAEMSLDCLPTYLVASDDLAKMYDIGASPRIDSKDAVFLEGAFRSG